MLHLSYTENTILDTFTADSPNPRRFVFETVPVITNNNGTYDDDDGTNIKFVPIPEDPAKAIEFKLSKTKTTTNNDNEKEDEKQHVKKRKPLNLTFNQLEEAAEDDQDPNELDYEGN